jgi:DNA-binding transcriptional MerR regulator/methylmalonyl-CoA mutase cobalamin-binding subunit
MNEIKPAAPSQPVALTIGAVSRATGLSPDILRVWQKRYGFPVPRRKPSGHRLYAPADVRRLRRIAEAISRGHRPAQVVPLAETRLETLLAEEDLGDLADQTRRNPLAGMLELVVKHRRGELTAALLAEAATMGPLEFLETRIGPLTSEVGEAWARGEIGIHQEHFYSECAEDVLRTIRLPYERSATGPTVILATLSGEQHGLGLQMVALVTAVAGLRPHVLGTDTPVSEIADAWVMRNAEAIGISVSLSSGGVAARRYLAELRDTIPFTVPIFVGGKGARRAYPPPGVALVEDLRKVHDWMRTLKARAS